MAKIPETRQKILDLEIQQIKNQDELDKANKESAAEDAKKAKQLAAQNIAKARLKDLQVRLNSLQNENLLIEKSSEKTRISMLDPIEKIRANTEFEIKLLNEKEQKLIDEFEAAKKLAKTDEDRIVIAEMEQELFAARLNLIEAENELEKKGLAEIEQIKKDNAEAAQKRKDAQAQKDKLDRKKEIDDIMALNEAAIGTFSALTNAAMTLTKEFAGENKTAIRALFEMQKVAAIGEVAMITAKSIAQAMFVGGPLGALMATTAIATGAAQTAVIASQKAPEFHMGGTPDEGLAIVKTGEAILDANTVNNLGGEQGINRLQNGANQQPQVIVLSAFKHFDRYMADRQKNGMSARTSRRSY